MEERSEEERRTSASGEKWGEPILWHWGCSSCGGDRWSWLLHLSNQERRPVDPKGPASREVKDVSIPHNP